MDKSSFAKGGIRRLKTPFLAKNSGKGVFCFDRIYRMNSGEPQRHWRKTKNKEKGRIGEFLSRMGEACPELVEWTK